MCCCSCRCKGWRCCALVLAIIYLAVYGIAFLVDLYYAIRVNEVAGSSVNFFKSGTFTECLADNYLLSWTPELLWGTCVSNLVHLVGATLLLVGVCHEKAALAWAWIPIAWFAHTLMLVFYWLTYGTLIGFYMCMTHATHGKSFYVVGYSFWHVLVTGAHIFTTVVVVFYAKDLKKAKDGPPLAYTEEGYAYRPGP